MLLLIHAAPTGALAHSSVIRAAQADVKNERLSISSKIKSHTRLTASTGHSLSPHIHPLVCLALALAFPVFRSVSDSAFHSVSHTVLRSSPALGTEI